MEKKYFISMKPLINGTYSIHKEGCPFLPGQEKHIYLGTFQSVKSAIDEGQKYSEAAGICRFCLMEQCPEKNFRIFPGTLRISGFESSVIPNDPEHVNAFLYCKN